MDGVLAILLLIPAAYFLGTFPSAAIVANAAGRDITKEGSGNPGASNTFRLLGWKAGLLVLLLDMGKGALAAGVGIAIEGHRGAWILGIAAVLGHVFPVQRHFKGGRGVATAGGVIAALFPIICAGMAIVWFFIARVLHKASVASVVCAIAFPIAVAAVGWGPLDIAISSALGLLVIARHLGNLRRLVRGEEPDVSRTLDEGDG
jgi:glycerol-3-phosphate acyltransferase PlsY